MPYLRASEVMIHEEKYQMYVPFSDSKCSVAEDRNPRANESAARTRGAAAAAEILVDSAVRPPARPPRALICDCFYFDAVVADLIIDVVGSA